MIRGLIRWSLENRVLVLLIAIIFSVLGARALQQTPVDAIPDLSDVQVIIKTAYPGQAPGIVEQQITYPLSTALLSVPGAHSVRGFSFYGDSYIYVVFAEGTNVYWARSRVLEYLNQASDDLPQGVQPQIGPDASGVGWVYVYALRDTSGATDLAHLRSLQDWLLRYELQAVEGVAEVAPIGGVVKQYQVLIDPQKMRFHNIPLMHVRNAINRANTESGAGAIELAEAEYMLRITGYIHDAEALGNIPLGISNNGVPLLLRHIADINEVAAMRRSVGELNGEGETVGGIIIMRHGENAQATIERIKQKIAELKASLPPTVEIVPVYDRSRLIGRAIHNMWSKVAQELTLVAVLLLIFLASVRSALVAMITLPIGILISFFIMRIQGINANIMSLGGIAIALGTMIDGAIVMIENLQRKCDEVKNQNHWQTVYESAQEIGPTLFFSLLIITVSFMPVFTLEAEEGRLFLPLALTKTYAMATAALLAVTLMPVLLYYFLKPGKAPRHTEKPSKQNRMQQILLSAYHSPLRFCLHHPKIMIAVVVFTVGLCIIPLLRLSSEFMPPLDEGDLMYMPTTYPGISIGKARELLQQTDKIIRTVPEVESVFGKVGRAETATDPAPLTMIETFIQLKPRDQWRDGMSTADLIRELDHKIHFPGLSDAWVMPIKTRIDMLSTGMKTQLGIKLAGPDNEVLEKLAVEIETLLQQLPQTRSAYAERNLGGRYLTIEVDKIAAARHGLSQADVNEWLQMTVGDMPIGETVEGAERYPISLRFPDDYRDTPERLEDLPILKSGALVRLGDIANLRIETGAHMFKSENGRPNSWIYLDTGDASIADYMASADAVIAKNIQWPVGYTKRWSGQFESMARVRQSLEVIVPLTLMIIALLLYLNFRRVSDALLLLASLPFALVGGLLFVLWLDFKISVAVAVGFIALAGLAVETGAIMLQVLRSNIIITSETTQETLRTQVAQYASQRLRPVLMTAITTVAGLTPVMVGQEPGSEIMSRIAAPVIGGLLTSVLLTLFVIPAIFLLIVGGKLEREF